MMRNRCLIISPMTGYADKVVDSLNILPFVFDVEIAFSVSEGIQMLKHWHTTGLIIIYSDKLETQDLDLLKHVTWVSVIVISGEASDAVVCYDSGIPTDFLLSNYEDKRFLAAVNRALTKAFKGFESSGGYVFLKIGRTRRKFLYNEIIFFNAWGVYSKIYTESGKFVINEPFIVLERKLPKHIFTRVHKSFIINIDKIVSIQATHVELTLGQVPVGNGFRMNIENLGEHVLIET